MTIEEDEIFQTLSEMHDDSNYDALQELIQQQKGYHIQSIQCRVLQLLFSSYTEDTLQDFTDILDDVQELLQMLQSSDQCMPADIEINGRLQELYDERAAQFMTYQQSIYKRLFDFDGAVFKLSDSEYLEPSYRDLKNWINQIKTLPIYTLSGDSLQIQKKGDPNVPLLRSFVESHVKPALFARVSALLQPEVRETEKTLLETVQQVLYSDQSENVVYTEYEDVGGKMGKKNSGEQQQFKITQRCQTIVNIIQNLPNEDKLQVRDIVGLWLAHEASDPVLLYNDTVYLTDAVVTHDVNDLIPRMRKKAVGQLTDYIYKMSLVKESDCQLEHIQAVTERCLLIKQKLKPLHLSIRSEAIKEAVESALETVDFQLPQPQSDQYYKLQYAISKLKLTISDCVDIKKYN